MADLKIGVIIGTNRPGRNGIKVAEWFKGFVAQHATMEFDFVDLQELNLPFMDEPDFPASRNYQHEYTKHWSERASTWDGVIVITPEYNHGYPAVVKNALDYLFHEWVKKPIAFVGYGSNGAYRAVEQLRLVSVEFEMVPIREQVAITIWNQLDDKGGFVSSEQIEKKAGAMLEQLEWWAKLLKTAR